jgi:hypothetical protein
MMKMKKMIFTAACLLFIFSPVMSSTRDDNSMTVAEQAFKDKKYSEAKTIFEELKDKPKYREKAYLYLAMIYHETGQVENALSGMKKFQSYITDKTDISLLATAENLNEEIQNNYATLDIAIFSTPDEPGVDPGYYNLRFDSQGGLKPAQEERLTIINRVLSQSQGILNWKSDGTFLKGSIKFFPIKLFETTPLIAEVNGVPVYFRFDFQTLQGLWIPSDILEQQEEGQMTIAFDDNFGSMYQQGDKKNKSNSRLVIIGTAIGAVVTAVAFAIF